jgi:endonuclease-3 related protein
VTTLPPLSLEDLPGALRGILGPHEDWWDVDTPFEVLLGSVLVQNTSWRGVERSLARLREAGVAAPPDLLAVPTPDLVELIRPTGFPVAKERALRGLCDWWTREVGSSPGPGIAGEDEDDVGGRRLFAASPVLAGRPTEQLRAELLALRGIGPETADVLLLYLLGRGRFVADAYARRLFTRLGRAVPRGYDAFAAQIHAELGLPLAGWQEFHALIDDYGKLHCRTDAAWEAGPLSRCRLDPGSATALPA